MAHCPVCKTECGQSNKCLSCGFADLRIEFLNREEAENWKKQIVAPYKKSYILSLDKKQHLANEVCTTKPGVLINNGLVTLGKYPQSTEGHIETLSWIVIKEVDDRVLLLCEKCIDTAPFDDVKNTFDCDHFTWHDSYIRRWLNTTFFDCAFTEDEKKQLVTYTYEESGSYYERSSRRRKNFLHKMNDYVFLLSFNEVPVNVNKAKSELTEYAKMKGLKGYNPNRYSPWWLRDVGFSTVSIVRASGEVDKRGYEVNSGFEPKFNEWSVQGIKIGVRPAIWVRK